MTRPGTAKSGDGAGRNHVDAEAVRDYLIGLQQRIVDGLQALDGHPFSRDVWQRDEGGGGISRILEDGALFERAGVGFSHVLGHKLPAAATARRPELIDRPWQAMGVSLVLHPRNPYVPTVHMNVRFFIADSKSTKPAGVDPVAGSTSASDADAPVWWFGGGMDLTPYYGFDEDARHFHQTCRSALAPFGDDLYPRYKRWCDEYFFLRHRQEPRGIGGIFFDDVNDSGFDASFAMVRSVGNAFLPAYQPIVERRRNILYGEAQRDFQAYRRGRYVEFNLVWDRGTLFGLQSGGRTESILMSMPPRVAWRYNWQPEPGTPEHELTSHFLVPRDWCGS